MIVGVNVAVSPTFKANSVLSKVIPVTAIGNVLNAGTSTWSDSFSSPSTVATPVTVKSPAKTSVFAAIPVIAKGETPSATGLVSPFL